MGLALLLLLWLITMATAYLFAQSWLPAAISSGALRADSHLQMSLAILGVVFVMVHVMLGWMVWRHRENALGERDTRRSSLLVESASVAVAAVLFLGMNLYAAKSWARHSFVGPAAASNDGPIRVEITGQQFRWYFRYPGPDGKFGATKVELQDASLGNPLGIDPADGAGSDDKVSALLAVPVGRHIEITLRSQDVIHSFFVRELRLKQDAVPGMASTIHFRADSPGDFEIVCAELCGQGHHQMNAKLKVLPEVEFGRWLAGGAQ
jgi:cytochrome c oxidase subunit II